MKKLFMLMVLAVTACGPSAAELKHAQTAQYAGNGDEMIAIVKEAIAEDYVLGGEQSHGEAGYEVITQEQWYNPEGGRESAGAGDVVQVTAGSIGLAMIVGLVSADMNRIVVTVTPKTFQHVVGSPQPRELKPDDPNLPGWVSGRVESLQMKLYERLKKFEAK